MAFSDPGWYLINRRSVPDNRAWQHALFYLLFVSYPLDYKNWMVGCRVLSGLVRAVHRCRCACFFFVRFWAATVMAVISIILILSAMILLMTSAVDIMQMPYPLGLFSMDPFFMMLSGAQHLLHHRRFFCWLLTISTLLESVKRFFMKDNHCGMDRRCISNDFYFIFVYFRYCFYFEFTVLSSPTIWKLKYLVHEQFQIFKIS